jgi:bifunctional ADP-heptose synthase (sugar kinase/adenylyltransferase)
MDTRTKIVTPEDVPPGCTAVTGYFDVLLADHVRALESLPRPLVIAVLPRSGELLNQRARAELAAGLRMVDYVVIADDSGAETLLATLRPIRTVRMEEDDARRIRYLIDHVRDRQSR